MSFTPQILICLLLTPPKSSHFVSVVLRTYDFVGIAPEKVNVCFAAASFFLERDKFKFIELISFSILHLIYNFYLNFSIPLGSLLKSLLCVLFFSPTLLKVLPLLKNRIISCKNSPIMEIIIKRRLHPTCRLSTCQVTYNN